MSHPHLKPLKAHSRRSRNEAAIPERQLGSSPTTPDLERTWTLCWSWSSLIPRAAVPTAAPYTVLSVGRVLNRLYMHRLNAHGPHDGPCGSCQQAG